MGDGDCLIFSYSHILDLSSFPANNLEVFFMFPQAKKRQEQSDFSPCSISLISHALEREFSCYELTQELVYSYISCRVLSYQ